MTTYTFPGVVVCFQRHNLARRNPFRLHALIRTQLAALNGTGSGNAAKRRLELLKSQFEFRADEASVEETKGL